MTATLRRLGGIVALVALAAAMTLAAGCGGDDEGAGEGAGEGAPGEGVSVTIADKGFTESAIVARLYAQALRDAGFEVEVTSLGSTEIADQAIRDGEIDVYPEYTGTAFLNVLGRSADTAPQGEGAVFDEVAAAYVDRGLTALPPSPYNNGNLVACTEEAVEQHDLQTLVDLGEASGELVYSANPEHLTRDDGLPLLRSEYGVEFADIRTVDISLRYMPIEEGEADCVYAFGTDPKLDRLPLVVLEDPDGSFTGAVPFHNFPVVSTEFLEGLSEEQRAAFEEAVNAVSAQLTDEAIRALNAQVDIDQRDPEEVAAEFLAGGGASGGTETTPTVQ